MSLRPLSNWDISRYYAKNPYFGGVISKDQLLDQESLLKYNDKRFWAINMEDSDKGGGSHWTLLSFLNPDYGVYFDSFSTPPPKDVLTFMKKYRGRNFMNEGEIQDIQSTSCGWYVIYVIDNLLKGRKYLDILEDFSYTDLKGYNEKVLKEYFKTNKRLRG